MTTQTHTRGRIGKTRALAAGLVVAAMMATGARPQQRLFALDDFGEGGWLTAMRLEGYAPRAPRGARPLQQALFPYAEALQL